MGDADGSYENRLVREAPVSSVRCSHCGEGVFIARGSWIYRYTQILLHLDHCMPAATEHERQSKARAIAIEPQRTGALC